jgi:uncharacterized protein (DUF983 family)
MDTTIIEQVKLGNSPGGNIPITTTGYVCEDCLVDYDENNYEDNEDKDGILKIGLLIIVISFIWSILISIWVYSITNQIGLSISIGIITVISSGVLSALNATIKSNLEAKRN